MAIAHFTHLAMAAEFALWLVGDDGEHLAAAAQAAWDEVDRVERLLSRFDRASEVARVNREAASHPVLVSRELWQVLVECRTAWERTEGYFDVCAGSQVDDLRGARSFGELVELDAGRRSVRLARSGVRLDFGGYGKGYALERAAETLHLVGLSSFAMHGGTSSMLARGRSEEGEPWRFALRDPQGETGDVLLSASADLQLTDQAASVSGARRPGEEGSDLIDPRTAAPLNHEGACVVVADRAEEAEILSTALLAMGRARAAAWWRHQGFSPDAPLRAAWIEAHGEERVAWFE